MTRTADADVIIIGGGHNGLVAAAYLARAGRRVIVLEAREQLGGAVASQQVFEGVPAKLSRFAYLVSLLPDKIVSELELDLELRSRPIASYTPIGIGGLLIERVATDASRASFAQVTGRGEEYARWEHLMDQLRVVAKVVAPTLTGPLPRAGDVRGRLGTQLWTALVERPIGEFLEATLSDDTVRGVVATDALIGTFASTNDRSCEQNRCFLYHVIGNGSGEWKVPVGGMGRIASELTLAAKAAGAALRTGCQVAWVERNPSGGGSVTLADGSRYRAPVILANCAPAALWRLLGGGNAMPEGCQTKINLVVRRLPQFRSAIDPAIGFAGTLHLAQGYGRLQEAYEAAAAGRIPDPLPCDVYCHSLTDQSILSDEVRDAGYHTLTLFGLHTPARLFRADPIGARERAKRAALHALQAVLAEPLQECLATDSAGRPCIEVMTPLDIEAELGMPGGHIFHGDLEWPWLADDAAATTAEGRWGVATGYPGIFYCGSGAARGGGVSGIAGHNAAHAVLEGC
jgi:phytoene dehydrogenase-like protein